MDVRPLPGVTADRIIEHFRAAESSLGNTRTSYQMGIDFYNSYIKWTNDQLRMLSQDVTPTTLDRLITTPRYWMLVALDPLTLGNNLIALIELEVAEQLRALQEAIASVERARALHADVDVLLVADTNVYLHAPQSFEEIPWGLAAAIDQTRVRLVVPLLVIDEIDRGKRLTGTVDGTSVKVSTRARTTLRRLEDLFIDPTSPVVLTPPGDHGRELSITLLMGRGGARLPDADSEIVDQARAVADLSGRPTMVVSADVGMRLRARAAGLTAIGIPGTET